MSDWNMNVTVYRLMIKDGMTKITRGYNTCVHNYNESEQIIRSSNAVHCMNAELG